MTKITKCECEHCGKEINTGDEYFVSYDGEDICEECGDDLYVDDYTQYDDYPYIDGEGGWDGGQYEGDQYRKACKE